MGLLIFGVSLWALTHFLPSAGIGLKTGLVVKIGLNAYKGLFSLLILTSIVSMVFGWRSGPGEYIYTPVAAVTPLAFFLVVIGFLLMAAARLPSRIKQFVRHPQLSGIVAWATAHLLLNGDSRSMILFGGLGLWAIVEIFLINHREGAWQKSEVPNWSAELKLVGITIVVLVVFGFLHPYIAGMPIHSG